MSEKTSGIERYYLPALRGIFGDWVYYSCTMSMAQVTKRIRFAEEIHKSQELSKMIQRALQRGRSSKISDYLKREEQRFFNSLVVALYGGDPSWHQLTGLQPVDDDSAISVMPENVEGSIGLLSFTGEESIFALDGQHRLAGMKKAIQENDDLQYDEVPLIIVAHQNTVEGEQRTRRLFTTLNRTAVPVGKADTIALNENDVMAIITRYLIEEHEYFKENRIRFVQANNLPPNNTTEFTTIGNIYDVLTIAFTKIKSQKKKYDLQFIRPSDKELEKYKDWVDYFFRNLSESFPALKEYFEGKNDAETILKYRNSSGGHILFRPIGLLIIVDVIGELVRHGLTLEEAMYKVRFLPTDLSEEPYADIIWFPKRGNIEGKQKVLCRRLLLHMLNYETKSQDLLNRYAKQLEISPEECELPAAVLNVSHS